MHKFSSCQGAALCNITRRPAIDIERQFPVTLILTPVHIIVSCSIDHNIRRDALDRFNDPFPIHNINIIMCQLHSIRNKPAKVCAKHPAGAEYQCFNFSHHHRLSTYHLTASSSASSKSYSGAQPSPLNLEQSSEYRRS